MNVGSEQSKEWWGVDVADGKVLGFTAAAAPAAALWSWATHMWQTKIIAALTTLAVPRMSRYLRYLGRVL